ncbi:hypothetical protein RhiirB3_441815 [Rhizophagus irregularis]|nr:hypothetical protein RhiirB3_441815 [Rhizophagus irregularis]
MIHLMHPLKCEWLPYDDNYPYLLLEEYPECEPELLLTFYTRPPKHIAVYKSCKNFNNRYRFPFLYPIPNVINFPSSQTANPFHSAYHLPDDDSAPPYLPNNIVVPNVNFNVKIHNEDYHYTHLMAAINDHNLEALLFPNLFPNGKKHYHDNNSNSKSTCDETCSKYIKQQVLNIDSHFRLHSKWLAWLYLQLEKI